MKRLLALILAVLLLTGCTNKASSPPPTEATTGEPVTEAPTQPTTEPPTETPTEPPTEAPTEAPTEQPTEPPTQPDSGTASELTGMSVHFLDVGHGDCAFISCEGEYALVDGGYPESGDKIVSYLQAQGVQTLDLVVGTHPHGDHIGGLPAVLGAFPTETVWSSQLPFSNGYVTGFRSGATSAGAEFVMPRPGDSFLLGSARIDVIGPVNLEYEDANNLSLVLMVTYGDTRFLLTGDMEELAEQELVNAGVELKADVLKVGHHGSYSSTSYRFLRAVAPTYGVISLGANNEYGHPHAEPLSRLMDADVTIFRTDNMYDIVAFSDGQTVSFTWGNTYAMPWMPGDPR